MESERQDRFTTLGGVCLELAAYALLFFALAVSGYAQGGRAEINGKVMDQSGAVVPGAKVVATNAGTGQSREALASENGTYVLPLLPVGNYTITCTHAGFKSETHPDVTLTADQKATVDFALSVGRVTQTVEVSAAAQRINTTNGAIGQTLGEEDIKELPLNGRNPAALVFLAPGAVDGMKAQVFTRQDYTTFPTSTGASVNGGRQGSTYYMLDGANSMDNYSNLASPFPNSDATQEFQVITNNFDAQYGFSPGAVVSVVTKSGTNSWHGDAFDFLRNDALNARDFFAHSRDTLKRNQYGGSLGGKIVKDKLFIFGNYQGTTEHRIVNSTTAFVPNNKMLNGDFSDLLTGKMTNACGNNGPANLNFDTGQIFNHTTAANFTCPTGSQMAGQPIVVK
ncbi:MAG: carboxypeptidase regulatory-like domain-containing protein, partial [Candidatus Dormibacteraceae bacterium]